MNTSSIPGWRLKRPRKDIAVWRYVQQYISINPQERRLVLHTVLRSYGSRGKPIAEKQRAGLEPGRLTYRRGFSCKKKSFRLFLSNKVNRTPINQGRVRRMSCVLRASDSAKQSKRPGPLHSQGDPSICHPLQLFQSG